ncbi:MAG: ABC transporter substrate-binding protein [Candidatus Limiplasma sp.]|nr:ABC transporter substrate-binding protein [Candidatus Limiplasma sp.]
MKRMLCLALALLMTLATLSLSALAEDKASLEIWVRNSFFDIVTKAAKNYMALHPQVELNVVQPSDMSDQFALALSSGDVPDIVSMDCVLIPYYASIGALADITDKFAELPYKDAFSGGLVDLAQYEGAQYAVPFSPDVSVMLYNKAHFAEAGLDPEVGPASWDQLIEYAQKLTTADHYGYVYGAGDSGTMMFTFVPYIWSNGGDVMSADGSKSMLDQPEAIEALQLMCDLENTYKVCPAGITSYGWTEAQDAFLSGKASMIVLGSNAVWGMISGAYDIDAGICLIPSKDGVTHSSFSGGDSMAMTYDCANPDVAWDFIQYCLSEDVQVEEMAQYGQLPARSDLFDNKYFNEHPEYKVLQSALAVGEAPYSLKYNEMYVPFLDGLQAAVNGTMSAQDAFSSAAKKINALLAE